METAITLLTPSILTVVGGLLTYSVNKFMNYLINKMEAADQQKAAIDNLMEGMAKAQEDLVREAKLASADGKLTKEDIEKAKQIAWAHCIAISSGPIKDIVMGWSQEKVAALIKELLEKIRKN